MTSRPNGVARPASGNHPRCGSRPLRMVHLAAGSPSASIWTSGFVNALSGLGTLELFEHCADWDPGRILEVCRSADVVLTGWGSQPLPEELAATPGRMRYVCHITGSLRPVVPSSLIRSGLPVTNWGDVPATPVAEGALTLLLACLRNVRPHIETKRAGGWVDPRWQSTLGTVDGLRIGIYGFGTIARRFAKLCCGLGATIIVFDPFATEVPAMFRRVSSLEALFAISEAVSVHAALTPETRGSIRAAHLSLLPDDAVIINTARGAIFCEPDLFAELASGRLRAGLDVLTTDEGPMPAGHPARQWPNVILTAHHAGCVNWPPRDAHDLKPMHRVALENLERFSCGEPLRFTFDSVRFEQST